ncbi:MAG: archease [Gammaproteobacteria bacterium]|nr:archease [Gammaproteobacteria bacterium]
MTAPSWEHFPHDADIGIRGFGISINEAFEQAALAMTAVITNPNTIANNEMIEIVCEEPDEELLFVDWLNALVYEMATRNMLFGKYQVSVINGSLQGQAWGEKIDILKHEPIVEVKGATYTSLSVKQDDSSWIAQCVIDV